MADVVWEGGSSTAAGTAANWVGGSLPGSGDVVVFNSTASADCIWDASAIATVQGMRIEHTFDQILRFNSAGSLNLTSAGLEIQAAGKISAIAAFTFAFSGALPFTGNIESYVKIVSTNDTNLDTGNISYTGMFNTVASRALFTFTFAIPTGVDVIMDDGVYPNLTLTSASGTVYFAMIYGAPFNSYGLVDILNFSASGDVEVRKSSSTYYPVANDYDKSFRFGGSLTISSNYWYTYRSTVTYTPLSTAVFRFPADGETNYGTGANFYAQHYDVIIAPGDVAGTKCILDSGHILSCNSLTVLEEAVFVGPPEHPGSEIRCIRRPVIDGTWNFVQVADGIYSSDEAKPFFGVPQGGTGLQTVTKGSILIGNDMNVLSTDANLTFAADHLHVDRGIKITEGADHPVAPGAGYGLLWTKNTTPSTLIYTDDAGTDTTLGSGGGGITALTGDVTASGTGSVAATIADEAVTYAKMQHVSATSRVLGRITSGAGDVEELTGANIRTIANVENGADVTDETNVKAALSGATITDVTAASDDKVLIQDTNDSDNLKTSTVSSIVAAGGTRQVIVYAAMNAGTPSCANAATTNIDMGTAVVGTTQSITGVGGASTTGFISPFDGPAMIEVRLNLSAFVASTSNYYMVRYQINTTAGNWVAGGEIVGGDQPTIRQLVILNQNDEVGVAVYQNYGSARTLAGAQMLVYQIL
tara:strand:+ start:12439 stop:14541 length:2103 start_codon:yes stop_codon:yes gene_type:complete